jgi:hypothetical protein
MRKDIATQVRAEVGSQPAVSALKTSCLASHDRDDRKDHTYLSNEPLDINTRPLRVYIGSLIDFCDIDIVKSFFLRVIGSHCYLYSLRHTVLVDLG